MEFTGQQALAISLRNQDILVSAGAGAGKTRVLVTRLVDMMVKDADPVSAEDILVITFTNAAASEMRERICLELDKRLDQDPENEWIRRQVRMIPHADIMTIHGFCSKLIKRHYNELGIDPSFRICEEAEKILLSWETLDELMEEGYKEGRESFLSFVRAYAPEKSDSRIPEIIESFYRFSRAFPDSSGWFDRIGLTEGEEGQPFDILALLTKMAEDCQAECMEFSDRIRSLLETGEESAIPPSCAGRLADLSEITESLLSGTHFNDIVESLNVLSYPSKTSGKRIREWEGYEEYIAIHEELKERFTEWRDKIFIRSQEEIQEENRKLIPFREELIRLAKRYGELYLEKKTAKNIYDYDDLEQLALRLLVKEYDREGRPVPTRTAIDLSGKYKSIFVDEYQDVNLIQETIVEALSRTGDNHLFLVGDIKQSIYGFRQARPDLFIKRSKMYTQKEDQEKEGTLISLRENFRSRKCVISAVNYFFRQLMSEDFGGVDYDDDTALVAGRVKGHDEDDSRSELLLFIRDDEYKMNKGDVTDLMTETVMIAGKIRELREEGYAYSDMAILLRSVKGREEEMAEILRAQGIPVLIGGQTGYFNTREIGIMMNVLTVIDNVYQDIPMASVLLSSIGGFTEEDLMKLTIQADPVMRRQYTLYDLLLLYQEQGEEDQLKDKTDAFLVMLSYYRKKKKELPLTDLIWDIYVRTGYYYDVQLLPEGEKRKQNLLALLKRAEDYEKTVYKGLFYFNRFMNQMKTFEVEPDLAAGGEDAGDAVKILTIHGSKGLEFPVVFVSCLSKGFNMRDLSNEAVFHPELGIGLGWRDPLLRLRHSSFSRDVICDRLKKDVLEEELRLLYVAMTRAEERLILTGMVDEKKLCETGKTRPADRGIPKGNSYMDWLLPCLGSNPDIRQILSGRGINPGGSARDDEEALSLFVSVFHWGQLCGEFGAEAGGKEKPGTYDLLSQYARPENAQAVRKAFSWQYPYREETGWKRKYSVSELKKIRDTVPEEDSDELLPALRGVQEGSEEYETEDEMRAEVPVPAFLKEEEGEGFTGAMQGTVIHKVLEDLPFRDIACREDLYEALHTITRALPDVWKVDQALLKKGLEAFLFSKEGESLIEADRQGRIKKEVPFTIGLPASMVYPDTRSEETVVIQGIIDLCCRTGEGLWLIDYKTDRIRPGEEGLLLDRYRRQMLYYKTALEQITDLPVVRIDLYSFALQAFIPVTGL